MSLTLYYHPLSSFCWKALAALYEAEIPFEPRVVNLGDPADRAAFQAVWPLAKFPVLVDADRGLTVPESSIIIDYLAQHWSSAAGLIPADPDAARQARLLDRLFDSYVHLPMQQATAELLRPDDAKDPFGARQSREAIAQGYDLLAPMIEGPWALGEAFTIADCAALPALFYGDMAVSLEGWPKLSAYLQRLKARPSMARVLAEAEPFMHFVPLRSGGR